MDAGGRDAADDSASQDASERDASERDASERDASERDASERDATAHDARAEDAAQDATPADTGVEDAPLDTPADAIEPECVVAEECEGELGPCQAWACNDGSCSAESLANGTACASDPERRCGNAQFCMDGLCAEPTDNLCTLRVGLAEDPDGEWALCPEGLAVVGFGARQNDDDHLGRVRVWCAPLGRDALRIVRNDDARLSGPLGPSLSNPASDELCPGDRFVREVYGIGDEGTLSSLGGACDLYRLGWDTDGEPIVRRDAAAEERAVYTYDRTEALASTASCDDDEVVVGLRLFPSEDVSGEWTDRVEVQCAGFSFDE